FAGSPLPSPGGAEEARYFAFWGEPVSGPPATAPESAAADAAPEAARDTVWSAFWQHSGEILTAALTGLPEEQPGSSVGILAPIALAPVELGPKSEGPALPAAVASPPAATAAAAPAAPAPAVVPPELRVDFGLAFASSEPQPRLT